MTFTGDRQERGGAPIRHQSQSQSHSYRGRSPSPRPYRESSRSGGRSRADRYSRSRSRSPAYHDRRYTERREYSYRGGRDERSPYRGRREDRSRSPYSRYPPPMRGGGRFRSGPGPHVDRGTEEDRLNSKTLFIGGLPYSFEERDIMEMFEPLGPLVKISLPIDRYTGRNKGFSFVEYQERKDAEAAMEKYRDFELQGRRLKLDWDVGVGKKVQFRPEEPAFGGREEREEAVSAASLPPIQMESVSFDEGGVAPIDEPSGW